MEKEVLFDVEAMPSKNREEELVAQISVFSVACWAPAQGSSQQGCAWAEDQNPFNATHSWEQAPPAASSKHLGSVLTQTVRDDNLFLIWPLFPTRALLVNDFSGKDDFII